MNQLIHSSTVLAVLSIAICFDLLFVETVNDFFAAANKQQATLLDRVASNDLRTPYDGSNYLCIK